MFANGATPPGLTVLGLELISSAVSDSGQREASATAYYTAPSGAFVFASGSISWSYALDDLRIWDFPDAAPLVQANACLSHSRAVAGIQALMAHVMLRLLCPAKEAAPGV